CSLIKARIYTGRRHQIRRHLSSVACQILGDRHYGKGRLNNLYQEQYGLNRIFLHSLNLKLFNSNESSFMDIRASLPSDLTSVLNKILDEDLLERESVAKFLF